jgi:hypothetical protein
MSPLTAAAYGTKDLDQAIARLDALKLTPGAEAHTGGGQKEWFHFCIRLPAGHLIVNFSIVDRSCGSRVWTEALLTVLSSWPRWRGFVRTYSLDSVGARPGEIALRFGPNSLRFLAGAFHLSISDRRLRLSARIVPRAWPTLSRVGLGDGYTLDWMILPHLEAAGQLEVEGLSLPFDRAATYHDHNWGRFRWGGELAWEWGFAIGSDQETPWAVVFSRLMDARASRTFSQGALVWHGPSHVRTFHDGEVQMSRTGAHRQSEPLTLPPAGALLVPGAASGVPAQLELRAAGLGDTLDLRFSTHSHARLAIPCETNVFQTTLLNEAVGLANVRGNVGDQAFAFAAPTVAEFVRAV